MQDQAKTENLIAYLSNEALPREVEESLESELRNDAALQEEARRLQVTMSLLRANPDVIESFVAASVPQGQADALWSNVQSRMREMRKQHLAGTAQASAQGSSVGAVTLAVCYVQEQQRRALEVLSLTGAIFGNMNTSPQLGYARGATNEIPASHDEELRVQPIIFDEFLVALDIRPLGDAFYLQMTIRDRSNDAMPVEECDVIWITDGIVRETANTYEEGIVEFLDVALGNHSFTFSLFPKTILNLNLAAVSPEQHF